MKLNIGCKWFTLPWQWPYITVQYECDFLRGKYAVSGRINPDMVHEAIVEQILTVLPGEPTFEQIKYIRANAARHVRIVQVF